MKSILVVQHVAHEPLGVLHQLLRSAGFRIRYLNYGRDAVPEVDVRRYDGLIVLGGPMGVYEAERYPHLHDELRIVREVIDADKPVLGICLGAQLIAHALGARVAPLTTKEIGWYDVELTEEGRNDPMLSELPPRESIFQWHRDGFELPEGAIGLATSHACPNQAFRYGPNVYALQFHLEVDARMVHRWLDLPDHQHEIAEVHGDEGREAIRRETEARIELSMQHSKRVFGRYLELFSTKRRRVVLPSRA